MKLSNDHVTPDDISNAIDSVTFHRLPDTTLTICIITLYSGYSVRGESACVNPDNYDQALGEKYAQEDAQRKIWPLLGFLLAHQRHEASK